MHRLRVVELSSDAVEVYAKNNEATFSMLLNSDAKSTHLPFQTMEQCSVHWLCGVICRSFFFFAFLIILQSLRAITGIFRLQMGTFGRIVGVFRCFMQKNSLLFPRHFGKKSQMSPKYRANTPKCHANTPKHAQMSRKCRGNITEMSGKFLLFHIIDNHSVCFVGSFPIVGYIVPSSHRLVSVSQRF